MKKLLLGICLTFLSPFLFAQSIKGRVTDRSTGQPVPGATVAISTNAGIVTLENGRFAFPGLRPGNYELTISNIGYRTANINVSVPASQEVLVQLEQIGLLLQPIEVKALRASEIAPFSKTNISGKELAKNNVGQDLPSLLQQTPSIVISSDAGNGIGYTAWRIRGTDVTRINMTINGIPYNDPESQGTFFVNLPDFASSVNSVQIQRGVGTSSNGAGAFGGSINFSTNDFEEKPYGEINNSYGSFNSWKHTVKAGSGLLNDHFTIDARVSKISSDGYVDRATSDLKSAYFSAAYLAKKSSVRFNLITGKEKTYQAWNGIPESMLETNRTYNSSGTDKPGTPYDNETDNYQQDHYQLFYNQTITSRLQFNVAGFMSRGRGFYENYRADDLYADYHLPDPVVGGTTITETDLVRQLWLDNHYYGGIYSLQYKLPRHEFTVGGGWNRYDGNHYGKVTWTEQGGMPKDYEWYNLDALKRDLSTYAKWRFELLPYLYTFADLQYRTINYKIEGFRKNPTIGAHNRYRFFNPKAGVTYVRNNWMAFASYAIGNKEPSRDDFEASATAAKAKHETLRNIETGVQYKSGNYTWGATGYFMDYKNQLILSGELNDVGAYNRINVPESYRLGIELEGTARINSWIAASANLTLSENKVKDLTLFYDEISDWSQTSETINKADISFSPAIVSAFALNLTPCKNLEISLPGKYVGRQYLDNTSRKERSLDDYYVQDLRFVFTIPQKAFSSVQVLFHLNNVFDRKYESTGASYAYYDNGVATPLNYYFPMAGINFMGGVNIRL